MGTFVQGIYGDTGATGWASYTGGFPSQKIYIAPPSFSPAGNDSNPGTAAAPIATLAHAADLINHLGTSPSELWVLLAKGGTWTDDVFGTGILFSGASATNPLVFSSYDPANVAAGFNPATGGARPRIVASAAAGDGVLAPDGRFPTTTGNNWAVIGLDMYSYKHDPNNAAFAGNSQGYEVGLSSDCNFTFFYIEDCRILYGGVSFTPSQPSGVPPSFNSSNLIIRRCQIAYQWTTSEGSSLVSQCTPMTIEECLFLNGGYNYQMIVPQVCAINVGTSTITWPGGYTFPFHTSTDQVIFHNGTGALPTGITDAGSSIISPAASYFVVNANAGAGTFQISATSGGSPITFSGTWTAGTTVNWLYMDFSYVARNHNYYIAGNQNFNGSGDYLFNLQLYCRGNIIAYDSGGIQNRCSSVTTQNLWLRNPVCVAQGGYPGFLNSFTYNVHLETGVPANAAPGVQIGGPQLGSITYDWNYMGLFASDNSNNIIANSDPTAGYSISYYIGNDALTGTGNIIYNSTSNNPLSLVDLGNGTIVTLGVNAAGSGGTGIARNLLRRNTITANTGTPGTYTCTMTGGHGSGATVLIVVDAATSKVLPIDGGTVPPPWAFSYNALDGGSYAIVSGGTGYWTGDVLTVNPADPNFSKIPSDFSVTVGPILGIIDDVTNVGQIVLSISTGAGIGPVWVWVSIANGTVSSVQITNAVSSSETWVGGTNFSNGDILTMPTTDGIAGASFIVTAVGANTFGAQIDPSGANTFGYNLHGGYSGGNKPGNNTVGYYYGTFLGAPGGFPATSDGYLSAVLNNNKSSPWNPALTAWQTNIWIAAGFNLTWGTGSGWARFMSHAGLVDKLTTAGAVGALLAQNPVVSRRKLLMPPSETSEE